jgi:hypothetical protein
MLPQKTGFASIPASVSPVEQQTGADVVTPHGWH